jgi:hypothetical protein
MLFDMEYVQERGGPQHTPWEGLLPQQPHGQREATGQHGSTALDPLLTVPMIQTLNVERLNA